jgi:hypothetical protein
LPIADCRLPIEGPALWPAALPIVDRKSAIQGFHCGVVIIDSIRGWRAVALSIGNRQSKIGNIKGNLTRGEKQI